jgi:hypothetical protein
MADQFTATINSDGSATVQVVFDITGTNLRPEDAGNLTVYNLPSPTSGPAWTEQSAIHSVQPQAAAQKTLWVNTVYASEQAQNMGQ